MRVAFVLSTYLLSAVVSVGNNESSTLTTAVLKTTTNSVVNNESNSSTKKQFDASQRPSCQLSLHEHQLSKQVEYLLKKEKVVLIEYIISFVNYTKSPLKLKNEFQNEKWYRVTSEHGQILLNLAFNYGVLSMATLTLGTTKLILELVDSPANCMAESDPDDQLYSLQYFLMRDLKPDKKVELSWKESICRKVVLNDNSGYAKFTHECVTVDSETSQLVVAIGLDRLWITILDIMLIIIRIAALVCLPYFLVSIFKGVIKEKVPYVVRLKDDSPLLKTLMIVDDDDIKNDYIKQGKEVLDLNVEKEFPKLRHVLHYGTYPMNVPFKANIKQYDILVDYHRTQPEDRVHVGFIKTLAGVIFRCKIKEVGPFELCCQSEMLKLVASNKCYLLWITFWRKFSAVLLVFTIPVFFYVRVLLYYIYEHEEVTLRKSVTESMSMKEIVSNSFLQYLTPIHPVLITIYVLYFLAGFIVALAPRKNEDADKNHVLKRIVNSFRDLDEFSFTRVINFVFTNFTWPFYKFGILGCFIWLVYWIFALPVSFFVIAIYSVPSLYLMFRMIYYCKRAVYVQLHKLPPFPMMYQVTKRKSQKKLLNKLKAENVAVKYALKNIEQCRSDQNYSPTKEIEMKKMEEQQKLNQIVYDYYNKDEEYIYKRADCWHCVTYIFTTVLCLLAYIGCMFLLAEIVVFGVEIIVFTIMGIIVNANYILRHVMVVAIVLLYCFDSFFNMEKKYLKLNKVIFAEVTRRIRDLESVTCLPSFLQENRGFKSQELNEQADYENPDSIVPKKHWMINDLVLFMDSCDTPRIPRKLFKEVCNIRVSGVPGPVYRGQLDALQQLAKVMFFVWLVVIAVMVFGEVYTISSTNQLIATVAGSFLPLILRSCFFQQSSDIEVNTVTFKSHMDELIKSFHQNWPIYDLVLSFIYDDKLEEKLKDEKPRFTDDEPEFIICLPKDGSFHKENRLYSVIAD
ncbi:hypothetical protein HELRODRAFT_188453 [Helobdella robusta]|uniref:Uncharacterized protein n=1 Tax=Helobdella robusta TaxID=6412 RepID=T1FQ03_HELRO|nr:hypothetical protein HELRODRAFT_188453 [Helobdella robusta]ESO06692.1 hypothetical protein HELRODRAFT_188453 [Helobdella robusta]